MKQRQFDNDFHLIDFTLLASFNVIIGILKQFGNDGFDIFTDIPCR